MSYNYADEINFIGYQLDKYYPNGWPWRMCAEIVNCSTSTVRKYYSLEYTPPKELLAKCDFSQGEIKRLCYDEYLYFVDQINLTIHKKKKTIEQDKLSLLSITTNHHELIEASKENIYLKDYDFVYPETSGLYMLSQIICNPTNPEEQLYLIKVGKSTNLKQRIRSYKGANPFAKCIAYKKLPRSQIDKAEIKAHIFLGNKKGTRCNNTEWYAVSDHHYIQFLKFGFDYLFKN